jgi:peptide/nickel transport system substrate-binding protein
MRLKRWLLLAPLLLTLFLLQSYFWVPTYENQATGNPKRLVTYIEGSIGDAKSLNPILNADSASSTIVGHVFEGLLDLDENLNLRGRLATEWSISEKAYLVVSPANRFSDGTEVTATRLVSRIQEAMKTEALAEVQRIVQSIDVLPPVKMVKNFPIQQTNQEGNHERKEIEVVFQAPERLMFSLKQVDQDFFARLLPIIGDRYLENFPYEQYLSFPDNPTSEVRGQIDAQLSAMFPVAEHNPIIDFRLRTGVRFHDGHEFDAEDVKFTYEAIMNPKNLSPRTSDFEPIKQVEVLDPYRVRVIYKRLFSPAITAWTMGILPEHLLNDRAMQQEMDERGLSVVARESFGLRESRLTRNPIGSGAYRFVEWQSDEFIHLARFDDYWEGPPEYHDYYMRIIPDPFTQEVEFHSGAVDYYDAQPHQVARYKGDDQYQSFSSLGFGYTYIGYNNRRPLFRNPEVRRALGMAINVEYFIKYLLYGEGARITGPYPTNTQWNDTSVEPLPYDPDGATKIFEQLGWKKNSEGWLEKNGKIFEFNLITNNGNLIRKNVMTIAQNAWKKIGVKCNTQVFEWAVFLKDFVNTGEFDAVVLGWSMGVDPDLYQLWHSSQAGRQQLNFVGYKSPKADDLIVRIRQEYNVNRQRKLAHKLHQLIHKDQPYTFLYSPLGTRVLDKKIVLVHRAEDGSERYEKIYPTKTGSIEYYFNKWRKLEFTPDF